MGWLSIHAWLERGPTHNRSSSNTCTSIDCAAAAAVAAAAAAAGTVSLLRRPNRLLEVCCLLRLNRRPRLSCILASPGPLRSSFGPVNISAAAAAAAACCGGCASVRSCFEGQQFLRCRLLLRGHRARRIVVVFVAQIDGVLRICEQQR